LFQAIVCCLQHVEILTNSVSARHRRNVRLFQRWSVWGLFFRANYLPQLSAAHNTSKYRRTLYRHVTGLNVRFSDFSPNSAVDVVETKRDIGGIVSALKSIKTVFSNGFFTIAHNTSKYWLTFYRHVTGDNVRFSDFAPSFEVDFVDTKRDIGQIVSALKFNRTVVLSGLFSTIVCCLKHVEILANFVSACYRAKCLIFQIFCQVRQSTSSKPKKVSARFSNFFGGQRRRNKKSYRP